MAGLQSTGPDPKSHTHALTCFLQINASWSYAKPLQESLKKRLCFALLTVLLAFTGRILLVNRLYFPNTLHFYTIERQVNFTTKACFLVNTALAQMALVLLKSRGFPQHLHHQLLSPLTEHICGLPNLYRQNAASTFNWEKVLRCQTGHSLWISSAGSSRHLLNSAQ